MRLYADLRLAARHLRRSPGYTIAAVLTLAAAIGANAGVFSIVRAVLLRPLPVQAPGGIVVAWQTDAGAGQAVIELTYRHLREWTEAGAPFAHASLMATHTWDAALEQNGEIARVHFAGVSSGFFDTLGATPIVGRTFRPDDDRPVGARPVAILGHDMWTRRFGGDRSVVGRTMTLDGEAVEIVGVMPPALDVPRGAEFWMPAARFLTGGNTANLANLDRVGVFYVVARTRGDVSVSEVRGALDELEARLDLSTPGRLKWGDRAVVVSLADHLYGPVRRALWLLWGAVTVLLLIACANLSGLLLTRVSRARHELGVRLALGASRLAIARLWLIEILLLTAAGGAVGLGLATALVRAIVGIAAADVPRLDAVTFDATVAGFSFGTMLVAALLAGLVPIQVAARTARVVALDAAPRVAGTRTHAARSTLLVVQVALAVVLLVSAGLIVRSMVNLQRTTLGFVPDRVLTMLVQPRGASEPPNQWIDRLVGRVAELPDVEAAGAIYLRPLALGPIGAGVRVGLEGQPETPEAAAANPTLNYQAATPGYFEAMRIPLLSGRLFDARDSADAPRVSLVSESTARRLWPGQDAVGRRIRMSSFRPGGPRVVWREVVGVVADVRYRGLDEVQLDVYDPSLQVGQPATTLVVRTSGAPLAAAGAVQALARSLDPQVLVDEITTMDAVVARAQAPWRLSLWMFGLFASIAFGLAALGLFSVVALDVAERRREFAVRLALGAEGRSVVRGVLTRAGWRVAIGVAGGVALALAGTRTMRSLLVEVAPADAATYAGVLALVAVVVSVAAYLPARRAARANPQELFRNG